mmetsp:Transcript_12302/g.18043  ORF Transcript_12302/g.18043 Transcript_12302/m.18043 type:complete len:117 (+) Transcript_12302:127-477(+)
MRREEEIVDACIAITALFIFLILYCCAFQWRYIKFCCGRMNDCLCCRKCSPSRGESYNDLEELLFGAEEDTGGRLKDESGQAEEISVQNFFCDVLSQNPKRAVGTIRQDETPEPLL